MVKEYKQKRLVDIDYVFNFGKHAGFSYREVVWKYPDYIKFLLNKELVRLTEDSKNELYHAEFNKIFKIEKKLANHNGAKINLKMAMESALYNIDSIIHI